MIREYIGEAAMWEQLAEETSELTQAALKMARILREENPTPVTIREAAGKITEEFTDVVQCAIELNLSADASQMYAKWRRFTERAIKADEERVRKQNEVLKKAEAMCNGIKFGEPEEQI